MIPVIVLIHICSAVIGLLSGFAAVFLRKGSGWHGAAGSVFTASMLTMSSSAAYTAAFLRPNALNFTAALVTFYLVATAWRLARRREGGATRADVIAALFIAVVAASGISFGFDAAGNPRGLRDGMPAAAYFVFGSIAALFALSDVRMIRRGGVTGSQRIRRHLWRMCLALLIATLSFFPGQGRQLPESMRESNLMFVPHVLLVGAMCFGMYRYRARRTSRHDAAIEAQRAAMLGDERAA